MKKSKKLVALLLTLAMAIGLFAVTAFALPTDNDQWLFYEKVGTQEFFKTTNKYVGTYAITGDTDYDGWHYTGYEVDIDTVWSYSYESPYNNPSVDKMDEVWDRNYQALYKGLFDPDTDTYAEVDPAGVQYRHVHPWMVYLAGTGVCGAAEEHTSLYSALDSHYSNPNFKAYVYSGMNTVGRPFAGTIYVYGGTLVVNNEYDMSGNYNIVGMGGGTVVLAEAGSTSKVNISGEFDNVVTSDDQVITMNGDLTVGNTEATFANIDYKTLTIETGNTKIDKIGGGTEIVKSGLYVVDGDVKLVGDDAFRFVKVGGGTVDLGGVKIENNSLQKKLVPESNKDGEGLIVTGGIVYGVGGDTSFVSGDKYGLYQTGGRIVMKGYTVTNTAGYNSYAQAMYIAGTDEASDTIKLNGVKYTILKAVSDPDKIVGDEYGIYDDTYIFTPEKTVQVISKGEYYGVKDDQLVEPGTVSVVTSDSDSTDDGSSSTPTTVDKTEYASHPFGDMFVNCQIETAHKSITNDDSQSFSDNTSMQVAGGSVTVYRGYIHGSVNSPVNKTAYVNAALSVYGGSVYVTDSDVRVVHSGYYGVSAIYVGSWLPNSSELTLDGTTHVNAPVAGVVNGFESYTTIKVNGDGATLNVEGHADVFARTVGIYDEYGTVNIAEASHIVAGGYDYEGSVYGVQAFYYASVYVVGGDVDAILSASDGYACGICADYYSELYIDDQTLDVELLNGYTVKTSNPYECVGSRVNGLYVGDYSEAVMCHGRVEVASKLSGSADKNYSVYGAEIEDYSQFDYLGGQILVTGDGDNATVGIYNHEDSKTNFRGGSIVLNSIESVGVRNSDAMFTMGTAEQTELGLPGDACEVTVDAVTGAASEINGFPYIYCGTSVTGQNTSIIGVENEAYGYAALYAGAIDVRGYNATGILTEADGWTRVLTNERVRVLNTIYNNVFYTTVSNNNGGSAFFAQDGAKWEISGVGSVFQADRALNVTEGTLAEDSILSGGTFIGEMTVVDAMGQDSALVAIEDFLSTNRYITNNVPLVDGSVWDEAAWLKPTEGDDDYVVTAWDVPDEERTNENYVPSALGAKLDNSLNQGYPNAVPYTVVDAEWEVRYALEYDEDLDDLVDNYKLPCMVILDANVDSFNGDTFQNSPNGIPDGEEGEYTLWGNLPLSGDIDVNKTATDRLADGSVAYVVDEDSAVYQQYLLDVAAYEVYKADYEQKKQDLFNWYTAQWEYMDAHGTLDGFDTPMPIVPAPMAEPTLPENCYKVSYAEKNFHELDINGFDLVYGGKFGNDNAPAVIQLTEKGKLLTIDTKAVLDENNAYVEGGKIVSLGFNTIGEGFTCLYGVYTVGSDTVYMNGDKAVHAALQAVDSETGVRDGAHVVAPHAAVYVSSGTVTQNSNTLIGYIYGIQQDAGLLTVNDGYVCSADSELVSCYGIYITDNTKATVNGGIVWGQIDGIHMEKGTLEINELYPEVAPTFVLGRTSDGIEMEAGTTTVNNGTITGYVNGIKQLTGALTVNNGKITGETQHGIYIVDNTEATVNGGIITGYIDGIHMDKGYLVVNELDAENAPTVITGLTSDGIEMETGHTGVNGGTITGYIHGINQLTDNLYVTGGTITGEGKVGYGDGIHIEKGRAQIVAESTTKITGEYYGIYANSADVELLNVTNNNQGGQPTAVLQYEPVEKISSLTITGKTYDGIYSGAQKTTVDLYYAVDVDCTVYGNRSGIVVDDLDAGGHSRVTLTGATDCTGPYVTGANGYGIRTYYVNDDTSLIGIYGGTVKGLAEDGIRTDAGDLKIEAGDNTYVYGKVNGVYAVNNDTASKVKKVLIRNTGDVDFTVIGETVDGMYTQAEAVTIDLRYHVGKDTSVTGGINGVIAISNKSSGKAYFNVVEVLGENGYGVKAVNIPDVQVTGGTIKGLAEDGVNTNYGDFFIDNNNTERDITIFGQKNGVNAKQDGTNINSVYIRNDFDTSLNIEGKTEDGIYAEGKLVRVLLQYAVDEDVTVIGYKNGVNVFVTDTDSDNSYVVLNGDEGGYGPYVTGKTADGIHANYDNAIVSSNVYINNGTVLGKDDGIDILKGEVYVSDGSVTGETGQGVNAVYSTKIEVTGGTVQGKLNGILANQCNEITVTGGKITGETKDGINTNYGTLKVNSKEEVEISGGKNGINAKQNSTTIDKVSVRNNGYDLSIKGSAEDGIYAEGKTVDIRLSYSVGKDVSVKGYKNGIKATVTAVVDSMSMIALSGVEGGYGPYVTGETEDGINVDFTNSNPSSSLQMKKGTVKGHKNGIVIKSKYFEITGGTIIGETEDGLNANSCSNGKVSNATVTGADDGIETRFGGDLEITNATVEAMDDCGVDAWSCGAITVTGSTITGGEDGICAYNCGNIKVTGSTLTGKDETWGDGLDAEECGGTVTVINSTLTGPYTGLYLYECGDSAVTNSTLSGGDYGIETYCTDVTVNGSTVTGGDNGISCCGESSVDECVVTVTDSTITGTTDEGIEDSKATLNIVSGTVTGATSGIEGHDSVISVTGGTITGTGEGGIKLDGGSLNVTPAAATAITGGDYGIYTVSGDVKTVEIDSSAAPLTITGTNSDGINVLADTVVINLVYSVDGDTVTGGRNGIVAKDDLTPADESYVVLKDTKVNGVANVGVIVNGIGNVKIENATVIGGKQLSGGLVVDGVTGLESIDSDVLIKGADTFIFGTKQGALIDGGSFTMENGYVEGENGFTVKGDASVNVQGGMINSASYTNGMVPMDYGYGMYVVSGDVIVSGAKTVVAGTTGNAVCIWDGSLYIYNGTFYTDIDTAILVLGGEAVVTNGIIHGDFVRMSGDVKLHGGYYYGAIKNNGAHIINASEFDISKFMIPVNHSLKQNVWNSQEQAYVTTYVEGYMSEVPEISGGFYTVVAENVRAGISSGKLHFNIDLGEMNDNGYCKVCGKYHGQLPGDFVCDTNLTLDVNGYRLVNTITDPAKDGNVFTVVTGGILTVKDTSAAKTGLIYGTNGAVIVDGTGAEFVLENGGVYSLKDSAIEVNNGTVSVKDGEVSGYANAIYLWEDAGSTDKASAIITGGKFKGRNAYAIYAKRAETVSISSGTFGTVTGSHVTTCKGIKADEVVNPQITGGQFSSIEGTATALFNKNNYVTYYVAGDTNPITYVVSYDTKITGIGLQTKGSYDGDIGNVTGVADLPMYTIHGRYVENLTFDQNGISYTTTGTGETIGSKKQITVTATVAPSDANTSVTWTVSSAAAAAGITISSATDNTITITVPASVKAGSYSIVATSVGFTNVNLDTHIERTFTISVSDPYVGGGTPGGRSPSFILPIVTKPTYDNCPKGSTCPMQPYTDIVNDAWYHDYVHYCLDRGLLIGTTSTTYEPNKAATRAVIYTILGRLSGNTFTAQGVEWYKEGQNWAIQNGISDGNNPLADITREQLVTMLLRYATLKGYDTTARKSISTFADASSVSDYAVDAMEWAIGSGLLVGADGNRLNPTAGASRIEVSVMLMRFCLKYGI